MFIVNPLRLIERKYDIVIVDEVDNMFIDQGTSPALLSQECKIIHYQDILNVIYYNRDKNINELVHCMNTIFKEFAFFNTNKGIEKIIELRDAALASDRKIKDIDYIVQSIIDSHNGLKKPE